MGIVVGVVVVVAMVLLLAAFENLIFAYEDPFEFPIVQRGYPALLFFLEIAKHYKSHSISLMYRFSIRASEAF